MVPWCYLHRIVQGKARKNWKLRGVYFPQPLRLSKWRVELLEGLLAVPKQCGRVSLLVLTPWVLRNHGSVADRCDVTRSSAYRVYRRVCKAIAVDLSLTLRYLLRNMAFVLYIPLFNSLGLFIGHLPQPNRERIKALVSKRTVVLCRWGRCTQKFGFIDPNRDPKTRCFEHSAICQSESLSLCRRANAWNVIS